MANYETLKSAIQDVVKTNGNNEITGALLQQSLLAMINSLGSGYQFMGVATPATNPGTPDQKVFYIATQGGVYSNFDGIVVANDSVVFLKYDSQWTAISTNIVNKYTSAIFENELGLAPTNIDNVLNLGNTYYILYTNNHIYSNTAFNTSVCFFPVVNGKSYKLDVPKTGNNVMTVVAYANSLDQTSGLISLGYTGNSDPREIEFTANAYPYIAVCFTTANGLPVLQQSTTSLKNRVTANENAISALSNSIDNIGLKLSNLDFSTVANLFDITNYGLYVSILQGKKYNITTGILQNDASYDSTTLVQLDKENPIYPGYIGTQNPIYFFDKDKNYIGQVTGKHFITPITPSDYPENAYYVAFSYVRTTLVVPNVFYTIKKKEPQYGYMYPTIRKIKNTRPVVNIYVADSEDTIFEKLVNALLTGDCDVYWETGEYEFKQVYIDMRDVYGFGRYSGAWQLELPLGGNCRYYLNNSIITGQLPAGVIDAKVFGTNRAADRPFVLEGGTIISDGMVYCIHDEGQGLPGFYTHIYKNLKMICKNGGIRCIGGGTGENGKILIENCEFHNTADNTDVAYHGITNGTHPNATFHVIVSDSWFSRGMQVNTLIENQTGKLTYMGNSAASAPIVLNGWEFIEWNNIIRQ